MRIWIVQGLTPILCGLAVLLAVIGLGRAARASLHDRASYCLAFADIDCPPPEGMSRTAFLSEVRAHTDQPQALHLLDDDLIARLYRAFSVHPWVESVKRVDIGRIRSPNCEAKSPVRVEIAYRRPVLAVPLSAEDKSGWRMVDRHGILLPRTEVLAHLPVLTAGVRRPAGPAGSRWGDARVAAAAKTTAFLQPHLRRLRLEDSEVALVAGEIVFHRRGVRIVWGHAPGQEEVGEAPAQEKLQRLLAYQKEHDGLEGLEHDVRLLAYQGHFPLSPGELRNAVSLYESRQLPSKRNRDHASSSSRAWRSCFNEAKTPGSRRTSAKRP